MITHHWIDTSTATFGMKNYYPFYRLLITIMPIEILRNGFDATAGIWIVGEEKDVKEVGNFIKSGLKSKRLKRLREMVANIQDEHNKLEDKVKQEIKEGISEHKSLRLEYIKNSNLKTLKLFRATQT